MSHGPPTPGPPEPERPDEGRYDPYTGSYSDGSVPPPPPPPPDYHGGGPHERPRRNGLGLAALVCGIVAIALSLIPGLNLFTWPVGVLAVVFGAIGWSRANRGEATNRGQAITGLVLGVVSFFTLCLIYVLIGASGLDEYSTAPLM